MGATWFTSDTHLGHKKIMAFSNRPFATVEEHDQALADRWSERVGKNDIVYVLGDLSIEGSYRHALDIVATLPGRKRLVSGNHDQCWVGKSSAMRYMREYLDVFEIVTPWARATVGGLAVVLSHFPYAGDHSREDRFDAYRLRHHAGSSPLLHGHTHYPMRYSEALGVPQVHVGVDAWGYRPVADHELAEYVQGRNLAARREWIGWLAAQAQVESRTST